MCLKRLMGASLLIFLNKTDVGGCMTESDIHEVHTLLFIQFRSRRHYSDDMCVQGLQLDAIKTHKWAIFPCSAMTGKNLHEGLDWVVQDAKDRLFLY